MKEEAIRPRLMFSNGLLDVTSRGAYREPMVVTHARKIPDPRANLALVFLEKWGMISGAPDGEDSAGRQKGRLLAVDECVTRAFNMADAAWAEIERRGWAVDVPAYEAFAEDAKNRND